MSAVDGVDGADVAAESAKNWQGNGGMGYGYLLPLQQQLAQMNMLQWVNQAASNQIAMNLMGAAPPPQQVMLAVHLEDDTTSNDAHTKSSATESESHGKSV